MFAPTRKSTSLLKVSFIDLTYFRINMLIFAQLIIKYFVC